ncbi:MAG: hypothetical protein H6678_09080 [Candidatus Delongbacteria bacterium]|nr:hypothetical protein [Candidatus Delongbacteria bacterium]
MSVSTAPHVVSPGLAGWVTRGLSLVWLVLGLLWLGSAPSQVLAGPDAAGAPADWSAPGMPDSLFDGRSVTVPGSPDPHGTASACLACHLDRGLPSMSNVDGTRCVNCHDARAHSLRVHSVDASLPTGKGFLPHVDLPLVNGRLDCLTCHGKVCSPQRANRAALRGGPFTREQGFCYQCHTENAFQGLSPHVTPLPTESQQRLTREGMDTLCALCHQGDARPGEPALRMESRALCGRCHAADQHQHQHLGVSLDSPGVDSAIPARLEEFEQRSQFRLPRDTGNRIGCTTCHLPTVACDPAGAMAEFPPSGLRLPAELICLACHNLSVTTAPRPAARR